MDIQYDFTPIGATGEIPGIIAGGTYIHHLVHVYIEQG
jgi:hypothetical protein